jgi:hypothetical protein
MALALRSELLEQTRLVEERDVLYDKPSPKAVLRKPHDLEIPTRRLNSEIWPI